MMTTEQFEQALSAQIKTVRPRLEVGLEKVGELASTMAAAYIGTYQTGWPQLAESTIKEKAAAGFEVPDPLLRTGEMRDSIKHEVDPILLEVVVGSNDKRALWQEMGTVHIPPRPFLGLAMAQSQPYAIETFGKIAMTILTGK
jgi:HK97 gp10 family phage protein